MNPFVGYEQACPRESAEYACLVGDFTTAARVLLISAEQSDPWAQCRLAELVERGQGLTRDLEKAAALRREALLGFLVAARAGDAQAQYALWRLYEQGSGVERDRLEAGRWRRAALSGLRDAAERGDADACHRLAALYSDGLGVKRDVQEGDDWYRRAAQAYLIRAEAGDGEAQYALAALYLAGRGVPRDPREASSWFAKAQRLGAHTICRVGDLFIEGRGRHRSRPAKVRRLKEAAACGFVPAMSWLGELCWNGEREGSPRSRARAARWFLRAAEAADVKSSLMLGRLHLHGVGGAPDYREAARWLRAAGDKSLRMLAYALGHGQPSDLTEAAQWLIDFRAEAVSGHKLKLCDRAIQLGPRRTAVEERLLLGVPAAQVWPRLEAFILEQSRGAVPQNSPLWVLVDLLGRGWQDDASFRESIARRLLALSLRRRAGIGDAGESLVSEPLWVLDGIARSVDYLHQIAWGAQMQAQELAFIRDAVGVVATDDVPRREAGFLLTVRDAVLTRMAHLRENVLAYRLHYAEVLAQPPSAMSPAELEALGTAWIVIGCRYVATGTDRRYRLEHRLGWDDCHPKVAEGLHAKGELTREQLDAVKRAYQFSDRFPKYPGSRP